MTESPAVQDPEALAQRFHEAYERLAPQHGYETREASAKPWAEVPAQNRALMTAVCAEILAAVLPVHREIVLRGAADYLDPGHRDPIPEGKMTSADWVRAAQRGAASNLRVWASPAFAHMWTPTDVPIGVMDTPELAARAVTAMNQDDDRAAIASAIDAAAEDAEQRAQGNPIALMYVRGMRHAAQLTRQQSGTVDAVRDPDGRWTRE